MPLVFAETPPDASVNAVLQEWAAAPAVAIGPEHLLSGAAPTSPGDTSARVWLSLDPDGLHIAAEIQDNTSLPGDRLEIRVAFPLPELDPIRVGSDYVLRDADACHTLVVEDPFDNRPGPGAEAVCRTWFSEQEATRKAISASFDRTWWVGTGGVDRAGGSVPDAKFAQEATAKGRRVEALIPASDLPESSSLPLKQLQASVRLIDVDKDASETILGVEAAVDLPVPVAPAELAALLEQIFAAGGPGTSWVPGARPSKVTLREINDSEYTVPPTAPSLRVSQLDLAKPQLLGDLSDGTEAAVYPLRRAEWGIERLIAVTRGGELAASYNVGLAEVKGTVDGDHIRVLTLDEWSMRSGGSCGACTGLRGAALVIEPGAVIREVARFDFENDSANGWRTEPDLTRVRLWGNSSPEGRQLLSLRWDTSQATWKTTTTKITATSLCERQGIGCVLENTKIVSICFDTSSPPRATYRYGMPGHVELELPYDPAQPRWQFAVPGYTYRFESDGQHGELKIIPDKGKATVLSCLDNL